MRMSNTMYDFLKWFSLVGINAFGTFYGTIGSVWGLPYVEEIKTTCFALGLFIGACIGISTVNYNAEMKGDDVSE